MRQKVSEKEKEERERVKLRKRKRKKMLEKVRGREMDSSLC